MLPTSVGENNMMVGASGLPQGRQMTGQPPADPQPFSGGGHWVKEHSPGGSPAPPATLSSP